MGIGNNPLRDDKEKRGKRTEEQIRRIKERTVRDKKENRLK